MPSGGVPARRHRPQAPYTPSRRWPCGSTQPGGLVASKHARKRATARRQPWRDLPEPGELLVAVGRNDLPGATPAERAAVRRLAAAYLLWFAERYGQFPPGAAGTIDDQIDRAERYVRQNPGGPPRREASREAEQNLDELLAALQLPNIWALFDAIGRDTLPGLTADERAETRYVAACVLLDVLQTAGVPLPVATPTPETLIQAAEDLVLDTGQGLGPRP
jgi:uncharacterized protein (DUF3820 family)